MALAQPSTQAQTVAIPKRLPLVVAPENRDDSTAKDPKLVNGYIEKTQAGEYQLYKRPGLSTYQTKSGAGQGTFNWQGNLYNVTGGTLYKNGTSLGAVDATNGVYRFDSTLGGTPRLVLGNGVKGYTYDNTTLAEITGGDWPSAFVKGWAYLDGTMYVMDAEANINGSDLNNPTSFPVGNVVTAQIEPDAGVALAKQLVYVIALKSWSGEVFYDAGNPAGSPLGRVQGAKISYGCISAETVQDVDGNLMWASTTKQGTVQVILMANLKAEVVSTKPIERLLEGITWTSAVYSWAFKHNGHSFYGITSTTANLTLVFDLRERQWYQFVDTDGNYWPIVSACALAQSQHLLQHISNGKIYLCNQDYYTDDNSLFTVDLISPNFDGGTRRRKQLNFLEFIGDQTPGSVLQVRKNDNDYKATGWSNFRSVDLSKQRPTLNNNGTFVKRAYNFKHRCNTPLRIQAIEMQIDLGTL